MKKWIFLIGGIAIGSVASYLLYSNGRSDSTDTASLNPNQSVYGNPQGDINWPEPVNQAIKDDVIVEMNSSEQAYESLQLARQLATLPEEQQQRDINPRYEQRAQ